MKSPNQEKSEPGQTQVPTLSDSRARGYKSSELGLLLLHHIWLTLLLPSPLLAPLAHLLCRQ